MRQLCPAGPRPVLRRALSLDHDFGTAAEVAGAAVVAQPPAAIRDALDLAAHGEEAAARAAWTVARGELARWLSPERRPPKKWASWAERRKKQQRAAAACLKGHVAFKESKSGVVVLSPARCNCRRCPDCARRLMRRRVERFAPFFAARMKPGFIVEMFTVGWDEVPGRTKQDRRGHWRPTGREDVGRYLRRLAELQRAMMEGAPAFGIAAGSWRGGLRVLEAVPRDDGAFYVHAHYIVVRTERYPYGYSRAWLDGFAAGRAGAPCPESDDGRTRAAQLRGFAEGAARRARGEGARPEDLGMRGLQRMLGLGEVGRHDVLTKAGEVERVGGYLAKVAKYVAKVEGEGKDGPNSIFARDDIMRALHARRLLEPFGDLRGLFGGPQRMERERAGVDVGHLEHLGRIHPDDPKSWAPLEDLADLPSMGDEDDLAVKLTTYYRADTLRGWAEWCDLAALAQWFRVGDEERRWLRPG